MSKLIAKFDTIPVNPELDSTGGYLLRLKDRPVYDESHVFEEVVKEKTLPFDTDTLKFAFLSVLKTMAMKVSRDCNPRKVGNYLKFTPTLRGKVKGMYSGYDPVTCSSAITVTSLSGLEKAVDENYVTFVTARAGVLVTILKICTLGEQASEGLSVITKGKGVICVGTNLQYLEGDKVEIHWTAAGGTDASVEVVPTESDIAHMTFDWPEALDDVPDGTELVWKFSTRGGIADSAPQANDKTVTLIEGIPEPAIDEVASEDASGVVKGLPFAATGENLGFNFATDHASVEWVDPDGTPRQAAMVPVSATAEKISFSANPLFDDLPEGTALTFTFELGDYVVTQESEIVVPPAPTLVVNGATSCSTPWTIHGASTTGMFHMTGENIVFTDSEDEGVWFTYVDDDGETVVKHAGPDKVHQSTTPGAAPYVFDRDFVGGDGSPDKKHVGTLKIACRAGVPGSALQVFEHECAWDVD